MKYFVKWECTGKASENKSHLEDEISKQMEHIEKSGKMKDGGAILGKGGYFIFDIDKPVELLGLLGRVFWENFEITYHPVVSYKEMGEYMHKEYKKAA
jgi:hypothetical protein